MDEGFTGSNKLTTPTTEEVKVREGKVRRLRRKNARQSAEETMNSEKVRKFLHITQNAGVRSLNNTVKLTIC